MILNGGEMFPEEQQSALQHSAKAAQPQMNADKENQPRINAKYANRS